LNARPPGPKAVIELLQKCFIFTCFVSTRWSTPIEVKSVELVGSRILKFIYTPNHSCCPPLPLESQIVNRASFLGLTSYAPISFSSRRPQRGIVIMKIAARRLLARVGGFSVPIVVEGSKPFATRLDRSLRVPSSAHRPGSKPETATPRSEGKTGSCGRPTVPSSKIRYRRKRSGVYITMEVPVEIASEVTLCG
jgi:hypothetical protein